MGEDDVGGGHVERGLGGCEPDDVADLEPASSSGSATVRAEPHGHVDRDLLQPGGEPGAGVLAAGPVPVARRCRRSRRP